VRFGFFKTTIISEDGREQLTGFQMAGEMLGIDAISDDRHVCNAEERMAAFLLNLSNRMKHRS
jgi:CRP-like cAMP-binding protein